MKDQIMATEEMVIADLAALAIEEVGEALLMIGTHLVAVVVIEAVSAGRAVIVGVLEEGETVVALEEGETVVASVVEVEVEAEEKGTEAASGRGGFGGGAGGRRTDPFARY